MKADPAAQLTLLDLQGIDARLDQLRHQRASLPELAELATLQATRAEAEGVRIDRQIVVDDLNLAQRKADADVEQVKVRRKRDQDRIDQGLITNPKDLERLTHELASLERRISVLEDEELEVMERLEEAQAALEQVAEQLRAHDERIAELTASREAKEAEIDAEISQVGTTREPTAATVPADLLALYEKLRPTKGGVAAAELRARQCGGCRLTLDHAELQRVRGLSDDDVVRCEECSRILVRTPESGL